MVHRIAKGYGDVTMRSQIRPMIVAEVAAFLDEAIEGLAVAHRYGFKKFGPVKSMTCGFRSFPIACYQSSGPQDYARDT